MNKQRTKPTIVAAAPMVHESGMLPYRIVIRDLGDQLVVHTEVFEQDKKPWYHQGDYFLKKSDAATADKSDASALRKAWARFEERTRRSLHMDPPPAKRLSRLSDIAENIVKKLLSFGMRPNILRAGIKVQVRALGCGSSEQVTISCGVRFSQTSRRKQHRAGKCFSEWGLFKYQRRACSSNCLARRSKLRRG